MPFVTVVLRLRFHCYFASVDAAKTRDYQSGFEPSANINLALSHRQNIDMFHVQTYLQLRSIQCMGHAHHLLSFPIPLPIHIATQGDLQVIWMNNLSSGEQWYQTAGHVPLVHRPARISIHTPIPIPMPLHMPMRIRISIRILVNQVSISGVELQDTSGSSWRGNTQCDGVLRRPC